MKVIRSIAIGLMMGSLVACTNMSSKQQGTLSGAAIGAAAGAGIADIAGGSGWTGAAIGAAAGGIAGNIYGDKH
ncbi:YMGG-like Gly-zipper domain-containing protein [Achromobacter aegrifaciens]|uniref:YMGG-like glycine zipper-containing protein n=1 Tax=Achromobacter aegrifaciens TaxID=1287736 RepID=UPI0039EFC68F